MLRVFERALAEKETEDSGDLAEEFTRSFLEAEPTPGIQYEYELHKHFLPGIMLDETNALAREWMGAANRVIMVNAPENRASRSPARRNSWPSSKR